ncbi:hypothetical protein [Acinetobacter sp. CFCC 10889]|uniref:hypothetical protein n=1 Tax=Acinetobacter sp. CFCC 10889 TaxID=1775557 RepID=UPI000DD0327F|nr:hypothetical protein [Acinetobacter sp. CFCC 10889]
MNLSNGNFKKPIAIASLFAAIAITAFAAQPAKEQFSLNPSHYELVTALPNCADFCPATLKADDLTVDLDYIMKDGDIEQIDNVIVSKSGLAIDDIYIDRSEYERISSAIVEVSE